ncbi:MAG TPA: hypothetical protein VNY04_02200 [Chthoniobacterales bacterium]|nr:hypothetical protein [Chthoniobacterales bacterium]
MIEVDLVEENAGVSAARTSKYQDLVGVGDICAGAVSGEVGDVEVSIGPKGQIFRPAKVGVDCITGEHVYKRKKRLGIVTRNLAFEVSLHWSI